MNAMLDDKKIDAYPRGTTSTNSKRDNTQEFECIRIEKVSHDQPKIQTDDEGDSFTKGYN